MADELLNYIVTQEHAGFSEDQIKKALAANGYSVLQIEDAFRELQAATLDPQLHEYVQQYARQGMTPQQIFQLLAREGYSTASSRRAIREIFGPGTLPTHHKAVFLTVAILVAVGTLYFLNPLSPTPEQPAQIGAVTLADQIAQVIIVAKEEGKAAAIRECQVRLQNDDRDTCILDIATLDEIQDNSLCDQIADLKLKDICLMNFIDRDRVGICKRVSLKENVDTCKALAALTQA